MSKNCMNCQYSYEKDLFMDNSEIVIVCSLNNEYIGYIDDIIRERCNCDNYIKEKNIY